MEDRHESGKTIPGEIPNTKLESSSPGRDEEASETQEDLDEASGNIKIEGNEMIVTISFNKENPIDQGGIKCKLEPQPTAGTASSSHSLSEEPKRASLKQKVKSDYDQAVDYLNYIKFLEWDELNPETNRNSPCSF